MINFNRAAICRLKSRCCHWLRSGRTWAPQPSMLRPPPRLRQPRTPSLRYLSPHPIHNALGSHEFTAHTSSSRSTHPFLWVSRPTSTRDSTFWQFSVLTFCKLHSRSVLCMTGHDNFLLCCILLWQAKKPVPPPTAARKDMSSPVKDAAGRRQWVVINGQYSSWIDVLSGVPQGLVLEPLLFVIFINDIDESLGCNILKFADDTKIYQEIKSPQDVARLEEDLANLAAWSNDWQMLFIVEKCKVLHMDYGLQ